eukprot:scaffold250367_cov31-Tisochrysis_lutea.AAC.3
MGRAALTTVAARLYHIHSSGGQSRRAWRCAQCPSHRDELPMIPGDFERANGRARVIERTRDEARMQRRWCGIMDQGRPCGGLCEALRRSMRHVDRISPWHRKRPRLGTATWCRSLRWRCPLRQ